MSAFAGVPMSNVSRAYRDCIPDCDSEMVVRYKQAGLIILGKTRVPALASLHSRRILQL